MPPTAPDTIAPLPLARDERDSLVDSGALAVTGGGAEVVAGLTAEETAEYLALLRAPLEDAAAQARHAALVLKVERARLQRAGEAPDDRTGVPAADAG